MTLKFFSGKNELECFCNSPVSLTASPTTAVFHTGSSLVQWKTTWKRYSNSSYLETPMASARVEGREISLT